MLIIYILTFSKLHVILSMENLNKNFIIEIRPEILRYVLNDETNYAYQEMEKIMRAVKIKVLQHFNLDTEEYKTSLLTVNLRHSELEFNKIFGQDGDKQDRSERLKWVANSYIEALDGLIPNLPLSSRV